MKQLLVAIGLLLGFNAFSQQHKVTKIWETDSVLKIPESVLPDFKNQILYVSLIDGDGWASDGKGEIAILTMDGKIKNPAFVTGLNAPKGLGRLQQLLYVADNSEVVVINLDNGQLVKKIAIPGGQNLNDIAVNRKENAVYVSDSKSGRIWRIVHDEPEIYLEGVKGANGLKCVKDELLFAKGKALWKADKDRHEVKIADVSTGIDGIEPVGNGDILVSGWAGYLYYISAGGQVQTLLDTHGEKKNAADISFDKKNKIIYIPSFNGKTVAAYQLL